MNIACFALGVLGISVFVFAVAYLVDRGCNRYNNKHRDEIRRDWFI